MKRGSKFAVVALLALGAVALPLAWHFGLRYRVSAAEEARVAAAWAELEEWAAEVTPAPTGHDPLSAVLDVLERAHASDGGAGLGADRLDGGTWEQLRLARLVAARAHREPDAADALAQLGHVLRTQGGYTDFCAGVACVEYVTELAEEGHGLDSSAAARWRMAPEQFLHAIVRQTVADGKLASEADDSARARHARHALRRLATDVLLPYRDEPLDLGELARAYEEALERLARDDLAQGLAANVPSMAQVVRTRIDEYDEVFALR